MPLLALKKSQDIVHIFVAKNCVTYSKSWTGTGTRNRSPNRNRSRNRNRSWNRNQNFSKIGTGIGTGVPGFVPGVLAFAGAPAVAVVHVVACVPTFNDDSTVLFLAYCSCTNTTAGVPAISGPPAVAVPFCCLRPCYCWRLSSCWRHLPPLW
jgi:hypothetical protein